MKKIQPVLPFIVASALIGMISACSTAPNNAPVVERGLENVTVESKQGAVVLKPALKAPDGNRGTYVVKRGDTLYRIALDHGQSYSDIVTWNNLKNPNDIKVDQVLRVTPPDIALVQGVQTSSVTSASGIEVKPLGAANLAINKSGPRGDKRPYSESTLADLQKTDAGAAPVVVAKAEAAIPSKSAETVAVENEIVDWMWPVEGKVLATFDDAKNKGLDISGKLGQDVLAAGTGKVMYAGSGIRGYGNLVIIKHTSNLLSAYAHNKTILVKEGQAINKGQKIAEMGNSDSDIVKLHFEIRQQGKPVDPSRFLPGR
ncbi:MAG: peptidoglycan DD-metalloendopeptidase family protein [Burkholderiales bacterium]|nr:peptidoglycan DD-metalloendopeptidase family protein [Burkholderiales bacterium]